MRGLHHLVAIAAVVLFVVGVRIVVPTTAADATVVQSPAMNVLQMQQDANNLPAQKVHDMTFALD